MSVPFATRRPTEQECERLRLVLSSFCDGSGMYVEGTGSLPGWRDFERAIAAVFSGIASESKAVFDVVVPSTELQRTDYGFSVKSKELSRASALEDLEASGRVYMELANSPAKFWDALRPVGISEADVRARQSAQTVGDTVLATVKAWHEAEAEEHVRETGRALDLTRSRYLVLSYNAINRRHPVREYQWHAFTMDFPRRLQWRYRSEKCLTADDPAHPGECLFDWYFLSGGQLKYYPRASAALYRSDRFRLEPTQVKNLLTKTAIMFPAQWRNAGGRLQFTRQQFSDELTALAELAPDERSAAELRRVAASMRRQP